MNVINIENSKFRDLPFLSEEDYYSKFRKGWSFPSVYDLVELKDVYLAYQMWNKKKFELKPFFLFCQKINLPFKKTEWNERRLLEHINALKNFSLIAENSDGTEIYFRDSELGHKLSENDFDVFRRIFLNYFRFKEIFSWFKNPLYEEDYIEYISDLAVDEIINDSTPLYTFSLNNRFVNSFLYELKNHTTVYQISKANEALMRFWDVFTKWGTTLGIVEKLNLKDLNYRTSVGNRISCVYLKTNKNNSFDLLNFMDTQYSTNYIYVPELIFDLAVKYRTGISQIKEIILSEYQRNKQLLSLERTSEIFIKKGEFLTEEAKFFLNYKDAYISHIIKRQ